MDYTFVPTVVFSHPPVGCIGYNESEAKAKFGEDNIVCYSSKFINMYFSLLPKQEDKQTSFIKLICVKNENERVVGVHCMGKDVDEMLQGVGIAVKMGATMNDFNTVVAIHPTGSEEFVLMKPQFEE